jgi:hypothetical protein
LVAVGDAELLAGAVTVGIDGRLRHPQFARDLFGAEMPIDEIQTIPFALGQKLDWVHPHPRSALASVIHSKPRLWLRVYFAGWFSAMRVLL